MDKITKKVMVVDDDLDVLTSVKVGLEDINPPYSVICVDAGRKCLKLLEKGEIPDLILLDVMMPFMSGWEAFDRIKENKVGKDIPIIFLTARDDDYSRKKGRRIAEDYVEKPFDLNELDQKIGNVLNKNMRLDEKFEI